MGSDILNDFFKPIAPEMDRLKSIKKHRIGRRSKQLERYEQKMKEERQKRIRERQKEFFGELEVHRYVHVMLILQLTILECLVMKTFCCSCCLLTT